MPQHHLVVAEGPGTWLPEQDEEPIPITLRHAKLDNEQKDETLLLGQITLGENSDCKSSVCRVWCSTCCPGC